MRAFVWYVGCCMVCWLLNGMWAVVGHVDCCMALVCCIVCGLLNGMWAVVDHVGCCMAFAVVL